MGFQVSKFIMKRNKNIFYSYRTLHGAWFPQVTRRIATEKSFRFNSPQFMDED